MERAKPLLYMRMPSFQKRRLRLLRENAQKYTTAFDVHETLLDVLLGGANHDTPSISKNQLGMSLLKPLPMSRSRCETTNAIPSNFCPLVTDRNGQVTDTNGQCNFMIDPPSVFSFYSDIPQNNRPQWPDHCPIRRYHTTNAVDNSNGP